MRREGDGGRGGWNDLDALTGTPRGRPATWGGGGGDAPPPKHDAGPIHRQSQGVTKRRHTLGVRNTHGLLGEAHWRSKKIIEKGLNGA